MDITKCDSCGKCMVVALNQIKCPFCHKDLKADKFDYDLPQEFKDIFGKFK